MRPVARAPTGRTAGSPFGREPVPWTGVICGSNATGNQYSPPRCLEPGNVLFVGGKGASSIDGVHTDCIIRSIDRFADPSPDRGLQSSPSCCGRDFRRGTVQNTYAAPPIRIGVTYCVTGYPPCHRGFNLFPSTCPWAPRCGYTFNNSNLNGRFVALSRADRSRDRPFMYSNLSTEITFRFALPECCGSRSVFRWFL